MNNDLKMSQAGYKIIQDSESLRLKAYLCPSGKPTIGWGHTAGVMLGMVWDKNVADEYLVWDVQGSERIVKYLVKVPLNVNQFSALVSFVFNVGVINFESSTLLRLLNTGDYDAVPGQLARWIKGTDPKTGKKIILPGLVVRRGKEAALWSEPL